jgi:hypothetical protein
VGTILKSVALIALLAAIAGCEPTREEVVSQHAAAIDAFCVDCHNDAEYTADLSLEGRSLASVAKNAEIWEKVVRKLRGGMMPPVNRERPDPQEYLALTEFLESELDAAYEPHLPAPGIHRLNRTEYGNAIRDLLALEVDATEFLPSDDSSRGFDNQAGTLSLSPALLEAYLSAAGKISRLAVGDVSAPTQTLYRVAEDTTQNYHVEGLPFGTRGGLLVDHTFPADGDYTIKIFSVNLGNMGNFRPFGEVRGEQLEILLDGDRVDLVDWDAALVGRGFGGGQLRTIDVTLPVSAGPHSVGVTFLASNYAPGLDLNNDFERSTIETGGLPGFTFYPHVGSVRIDGPYNATGAEDTPSRAAVFVCEPASVEEEPACAEEIVSRLARRAYRGFVEQADIDVLMEFYALGRETGGFDAGIEMALQRALTDPKFIYRIEEEPGTVAAGETYVLSDLEIASRLSFFIWSSIPDDTLLDLAEAGRLSDPDTLRQQVDRMLDDPRSTSLTSNFAAQWLSLRSLDVHSPVVDLFPDFDDNLRQAFRRETELFFDSIIRENRSILDLLTADYTYVNDRLAKHYGIPGVQGSRFRRVDLSKLGQEFDVRRGLVGKGSVLTVASRPARTAPVMRGAWIMGQVIGIPAPDPPPNVPLLSESPANESDRTPTIREQYEAHRANPVCKSCHSMMDPFGFALENFDATGRWRTKDAGNPIDPSVVMYDGTPVTGPADVRGFLLKYEGQFVRNVSEKMLTYALGRGIEYFDMPVVREIAREAAEDDYRFRSLIEAVVLSEPFSRSTKSGDDQVARTETDLPEIAALAVTPAKD